MKINYRIKAREDNEIRIGDKVKLISRKPKSLMSDWSKDAGLIVGEITTVEETRDHGEGQFVIKVRESRLSLWMCTSQFELVNH